MIDLQPIVLGLVQGITEFLPISSSGHLILVPELLGWELQNITFDVGLHAGTTLAVLIYFYKDWLDMTRTFIVDIRKYSMNRNFLDISVLRLPSRLLLFIFLSIIPVGIIGIKLEDTIEKSFRSPLSVAVMMIIISFVILFADYYGKNNKSNRLDFKRVFLISISQILALIPGTSRSGITISMGLFLGLSRFDSARISFLLATPIILGATLVKIPDIILLENKDILNLLSGFFVAFISGLICIKWLLNYIRNHSLKWFVVYRLLLGLFIIWFFYLR